jgi:hypothetical protein
MRRVWAYLSIALTARVAFLHEYGHADVSLIDQRWQQEKVEPGSTLQPSTLETLKNRHVLFIGGFMNGLARLVSGYYTTSIEMLTKQFHVSVSYYGPRSGRSVEVNAHKIYRRSLKLHAKEGKPLILVGHSKAGSEILNGVLKYPELILDGVVDRVVLIQAAIYGSPLAAQDDLKFPLSALNAFVKSGMESLDQVNARESLEESFARFEDKLWQRYGDKGKEFIEKKKQEISSKIFYVRSYQDPNELSYPVRMVLGFCRKDLNQYGKNDGLVLTKQMKCERIGKDLGKVKSDHISTTVYIRPPLLLSFIGFFNTGTYQDQNAFTRAILQLIYE